ncbi:MAG TPA: hypothetical protein VMJ10_30195 [Kofleriaceae bacterium]|nr:hypothetical protein [Kofleriaceae bacterium]
MSAPTDETTGDGESPEPPPFSPSEEWIDAYVKQCTNALRLDLKAYAKRRARGVGKAGRVVDESYAEDLVADALGDTLLGVLTWDPAKKSLYQHAEDVITFRTRHDRVRARKYKHDRLDVPRSSEQKRLLEVSLQHDQRAETTESIMFASQVIGQLRAIAGDDEHVHRYLDAIVDGATSRAEIIEFTGMSAKTFRNTRDRLHRLVEKLDHKTVERLRA